MKALNHRQAGLSLIEILVALAISSLILAGVLQIFSSSKQADRLSMSLARVQENGRFAADILNREFRLAGYLGCGDPFQDFIPSAAILANDFPLTNVSNQIVEGVDVDSNGGKVTLFGGGISVENVVGDTDVVSITYASPEADQLATTMGSGSSTIDIGTNEANFKADDILLISNCTAQGQFIFKVSGISGTNPARLSHANSHNSSSSFGVRFNAGNSVQRIVTNTYYVRQNARGIRSLYRSDINDTVEELIEGVENLQVRYGLYDNNDTAISSDDKMRWVDANTINSNAAMAWSDVVSIKAALLLSDDDIVLQENGPASYTMLGDNVAPASTDKRLRRVFTTTAMLRNRDGRRITQ